ncbi:LysM peptidoglycan-binding domain-containing protein [Paenibacillus cremeus]|nr:LysM peptidoglycan-binding domain-containing protein [Paenibacillus cremeus]
MILSISGLISAFFGNQDAYAASNHNVAQPSVTVESGDTLWSIASEHVAKGQDVREYVFKLKQVNGLSSSTVHEGQKLLLPTVR